VTELVQHLGDGHNGILMVITDLTVDLEPPAWHSGQRFQPDLGTPST
jgi:hypothetical protein